MSSLELKSDVELSDIMERDEGRDRCRGGSDRHTKCAAEFLCEERRALEPSHRDGRDVEHVEPGEVVAADLRIRLAPVAVVVSHVRRSSPTAACGNSHARSAPVRRLRAAHAGSRTTVRQLRDRSHGR
ncbi:MAG TPA: hypothetical protein VGM56_29220 [Byssovorax sp.]